MGYHCGDYAPERTVQTSTQFVSVTHLTTTAQDHEVTTNSFNIIRVNLQVSSPKIFYDIKALHICRGS